MTAGSFWTPHGSGSRNRMSKFTDILEPAPQVARTVNTDSCRNGAHPKPCAYRWKAGPYIRDCGQRFNQPVDRKMINSRSTLAAASPSRFLTGLEQTATQAILAAAQIRRGSAKQDITSGG